MSFQGGYQSNAAGVLAKNEEVEAQNQKKHRDEMSPEISWAPDKSGKHLLS